MSRPFPRHLLGVQQFERPRFVWAGWGLALLLLFAAVPGFAQSSSQPSKPGSASVDWLPDSVVAVVQFRDLGDLWKTLEQTKFARTVIGSAEFERFQESPQFAQLTAGRLFIEGLFEQDLRELLQEATAGPGVAALDRDGAFAVICFPSAETMSRTEKILSEFATLAGLSREGPPALRAVSYQGISAYAADQARIALHQGRIVIASNNTIGKAILDRALSSQLAALPRQAWYQAAERTLAAADLAERRIRGAIDLEALRQAGKLSLERGKDLGQELLFGGVLEVVGDAPLAVFGAEFSPEQQLAVRFAAPLPTPLDARWDYYFGAAQDRAKPSSAAPVSLEFAERIFSVRWHRDLGAFWNLAPQLITDENAQAGIAKAESDIATLFGGVTTVGDVLGFLEPQFELVVCQPSTTIRESSEAIKVPAFALVGKMRKREAGERVLRLAFQQIVSFANLNAGPGGYPPMEVMTERVDGNTFCVAEYMQLSDSGNTRDYSAAGMYRNFSPTLAVSADRLVLSSDRALAERIVAAAATGPASDATAQGGTTNSIVEIWPQQAAALAGLNRDALIAQRMLQTGLDRVRVAADIDLALALAQCVEHAALRLAVVRGNLTIDAVVQLAGDGASAPTAN